MCSRNLFVLDFTRRFFVRCVQIFEAYAVRTLIKFERGWRKIGRKSKCRKDSESTYKKYGGKNRNMEIRTATLNDLDAVAAVEAACFPAAEAASKEEFEQRLIWYGGHFWLLFDQGRLIAFVDGMVTDEADLTDEMYEKAEMHREDGAWQMIFGVNTLPEYRRQGCAARLLEQAIADAKKQGRKGLVLTCKDRLIHYYAKFGFVNEGKSESVHGNAVWYQMRLTF